MPPEPLGATLRGILFDKDGTLVDFDRTWGPAAHAVMVALSGGDRDRLEALMRVSHYVEAERRFAATSPLIAGSSAGYGPLWAEVLGRPAGPVHLRVETGGGYALGIATNDAEASARAQCAALGLTPHMAFVAGYDSGHGAKPEPGMVTAFADHLGVAPSRIAMVGDSPYDLIAARAAGAVAIAVLSGPTGRDAHDAMAPLADHVLDSVADLPALLGL
jgi:phosphoglycolate phosphatase